MGHRSPIEELLQEHHAALAALDALTDEMAGVNAGTTTWGDVAQRCEHDLHAVHQLLLLHFSKEEEGLFAEVVARAAEESPESGVLAAFFAEQSDDEIVAHTTLRVQLRQMEQLLPDIRETDGTGRHSPAELHDALLFSRDLLRRHAGKEERLLFPLIARLLTPEQMVEVRRRISEIVPSA